MKLGRGGDEDARVFLLHQLPYAFFVGRVKVGKRKQTAIASTPASRSSRTERTTSNSFSGTSTSPRGGIQTLGDDFPIAAFDERPRLPGDILHDGVVLWPLVPPDVQNVAVPAGCDHSCAGALVLEHRVGSDRGPMKQVIDAEKGQATLCAQVADARQHPLGRIGRGTSAPCGS